MQTGFYCVVQFQPDQFRREGVNVGVLVVGERDRELRHRFLETAERARRMFPGLQIDDRRFAAATRALARRILELDPTEEAVRAFIKKESSQLVILPPMRASIDDINASLARLFDQFVAEPRPAPLRVTCPRCQFSFDPAASKLNYAPFSVVSIKGAPQLLPLEELRRTELPRMRATTPRPSQRIMAPWSARLSSAPDTAPMANLFSTSKEN